MTTATLKMAMMMMMMMMMIVEMKMIVVKIIIGIIPRSTSTMVGTEMPISRQINVDNLLLYYVSHVLMLEGIISIVSIRIKRNSVSKKGGHQVNLSFNTSLCLNYSLLAEALFSLVLGREEGKETQTQRSVDNTRSMCFVQSTVHESGRRLHLSVCFGPWQRSLFLPPAEYQKKEVSVSREFKLSTKVEKELLSIQ